MRYYGLLILLLPLCLSGCPTPFTLGFPGELPTARVFVDDIPGVQPVAIHYPATKQPMQDLPVILFNTGFNQPRLSYDGYGEQFAQWGYVCVIKFTASAGLAGIGDARVEDHVVQNMMLLDWLDEQNANPGSFLYQMVDVNNAGVVGHSLGAGISIDTAVNEDRIQAAVSLDGNFPGPEFDPRPQLPDEDAALLFFYATDGRWCSGQRFSAPRLWESTSAPSIEVSIIGASHLDFIDSIIGLTHVAPFVCPTGPADPQQVRDIATRYMVAWFNFYLKGQTEFEEYFNGALADQDEADGLVTFRRNL